MLALLVVRTILIANFIRKHFHKVPSLMIKEFDRHVPIVQRGCHFLHQRLQFLVGNFIFLVKRLEFRQHHLIVLIPVQTILFLIVPQRVSAVHSFPEHSKLASKGFFGFRESHDVFIGVVQRYVTVLVARSDTQHQHQCP